MNLETLAGQKFILTAINGEAWQKPNPPVIEFGEKSMLFGKICNAFRGPAQLINNTLAVKNAATTKMMCLDGELNELETRLMKTLESGAEFSIQEATVMLKMGDTTLTFSSASQD